MVDGKCEEPERFLLFGQKNKISRLLIEDGEVPDVGMFAIPLYSTKDLDSLPIWGLILQNAIHATSHTTSASPQCLHHK